MSNPYKNSNRGKSAWYDESREYESPIQEYRVSHGLTYKDIFEKTGVKQAVFHRLSIGLTSPIRRSGAIRPACLALADLFNVDLIDLWPRYFCALGGNQRTFTDEEVVEASYSDYTNLISKDPFELLSDYGGRKKINMLLTTLSPREEMIIKRRFGIDFPEESLEEVGKRVGVSRERLRQMERKALNRLRGSSRREKLKSLLYDDHDYPKSVQLDASTDVAVSALTEAVKTLRGYASTDIAKSIQHFMLVVDLLGMTDRERDRNIANRHMLITPMRVILALRKVIAYSLRSSALSMYIQKILPNKFADDAEFVSVMKTISGE